MLRRLRPIDGVLFMCIANDLRRSALPFSIPRNFLDMYLKEKAVIALFYLGSQREASGLKRPDVELEEELWKGRRDEEY